MLMTAKPFQVKSGMKIFCNIKDLNSSLLYTALSSWKELYPWHR